MEQEASRADRSSGRSQVIFGNPAEFAIEAMVEPGPEFGPVLGRNVLGRIRVWVGGRGIGRIEEPACVLGAPCKHLLEVRDSLPTLWDQSLDGLSADEAFDRLDCLYFGAHRGRSLREAWTAEQWEATTEEARGFGRFVFLLNSSEAFDGWKSFLVRPTTTSLLALVAKDAETVVEATTFPVSAYTTSVEAFAAWLSEQERRLLPNSPR